MRALEFQCPLKFRCQTRVIVYAKCDKVNESKYLDGRKKLGYTVGIDIQRLASKV